MRLRAARLAAVAATSAILATGLGAAPAAMAAPAAPAPPPVPAGSIMTAGPLTTTKTGIYSWQPPGGSAVLANAASPDGASTYRTRNGWLVLVEPRLDRHRVTITVTNPATRKILGTRILPIDGTWTTWGGFHAAADGSLYLLVGRKNLRESDTLPVMQVRRYSASFTLQGTATVTGGQYDLGIFEPFAASAPKMIVVGSTLVVHLGTTVYEQAGFHHQTNFTFLVDLPTMTTTTLAAAPYVSHSFQQFLAVQSGELLILDHGDAYPRAVQLAVVPAIEAVTGPETGTATDTATDSGAGGGELTDPAPARTIPVLPLAGQVGANLTGVDVTGMVAGPDGALITGLTTPTPGLWKVGQRKDVFLIRTDLATGRSQLVRLSKVGVGYRVGEPRFVKLGPDRFAVLFDLARGEDHRIEYRVFDSAGRQLAKATIAGAQFATVSDPVAIGNRILWVGPRQDLDERGGTAYVFGLDISAVTAPRLLPGAGG